jgi:uncharacterized membrane protein YtjA (UPF0391 family)
MAAACKPDAAASPAPSGRRRIAAYSLGGGEVFPSPLKEMDMLHYALAFLVMALIAAIFGFGGIAAGATGIAKMLFLVFIVMACISFAISLLKK